MATEHCPECQSESIASQSRQYFVLFTCHDCEYEWEEDHPGPAQHHWKAIGFSGAYVSQKKQREKYEKMYGRIPSGWELHHIDRNPQNDSPANLIAIPKQVHDILHLHPNRYGTKAAIQQLLNDLKISA